jgi:hypothetical protein
MAHVDPERESLRAALNMFCSRLGKPAPGALEFWTRQVARAIGATVAPGRPLVIESGPAAGTLVRRPNDLLRLLDGEEGTTGG